MPQGEKSKYTDKQERKADRIAEGYEKKGVSEKEAERRAWATVNKDDGGGKQPGGSGHGKSTGHPAAHKGGAKGGPLSLGQEGRGDAQAQRRTPRAPLSRTRRHREMATTNTTTAKAATKSAKARRTRRTGRPDPLAVKLLKQDHREVERWFDDYEQLEDEGEKLALFNKIGLALKVHTTLEEEIFYPEERGDVEDDMLDEAYVEHDSAKKLIAEIEAMRPSDEYYDAKVKVLGEYIDHHVDEEEQELFPKCRGAAMDLNDLGRRIAARKEELMGEMTEGLEVVG
jgi:plasmid stabilization system protein ParE